MKAPKGARWARTDTKAARDEILRLCSRKLINAQIAAIIGISVQTLNQWLYDHPEFRKRFFEIRAEAYETIMEDLYKGSKKGIYQSSAELKSTLEKDLESFHNYQSPEDSIAIIESLME